MKIIGLCGGSGSGKGTVASIFLEYGIPSVDTDAVYRKMTKFDSPCLRALSEEFGSEIISSDGSLNRQLLASIVFTGDGAEERLAKLNRISHYYILAETERILEEFSNDGYKAALVDAPVLFESGFDSKCHEIICVVADKEVRLSRIMSRDSMTMEAAEQRIASQMSDEGLIARSNYVIRNNSDINSLRSQIAEIANKITK